MHILPRIIVPPQIFKVDRKESRLGPIGEEVADLLHPPKSRVHPYFPHIPDHLPPIIFLLINFQLTELNLPALFDLVRTMDLYVVICGSWRWEIP
jgi:hypothetical protein